MTALLVGQVARRAGPPGRRNFAEPAAASAAAGKEEAKRRRRAALTDGAEAEADEAADMEQVSL